MPKGIGKGNASMGRPTKLNADYFKHFAKNGKTKRILRQKMSHTGIACWFELLELLTEADNHFIDASSDLEWLDLLATLDINDKTANNFFSLLVRLGKIDQELWENDKIIWSQSLIDNGGIGALWLDRGKAYPEKPKSRKKITQFPLFSERNGVFPGENGVSRRGSAPSRAEQSIVYCTKAEEIKEEKEPASLLDLPFENSFNLLLSFLYQYEKSKSRNAKQQRLIKAQSISDNYNQETIFEKARHFKWVLQFRPELAGKNPAGYLVKSIEESYPPPSGYEEWRDQELTRSRIRNQVRMSLNQRKGIEDSNSN